MLRGEIRAAVRAAWRAPLIPALAVLLSATGLGFALAMWSALDALYLKALPVPSADRIVTILEHHPQRGRMAVTAANFLDWSPSVGAFSAVSGSQWIDVSINADRTAERLKGAKVLPAFFDVWGVSPLLGRTFATADFNGDGRLVIVSERVWRDRFLASPAAVGTPLRIDGVPHTIIGVMPAAASSIGHFELWVPWIMTAAERAERQYHLVSAIGRLRPDRSADDATAELDAAYTALARAHPETTRDWRASAAPLRDGLLEMSGAALASLSAIVLLTFGVACLNVGALVGAWWSGRQQELLTRLAIGGSTGQVARGLLAEAACLALAGVAGAIPVAVACLRIVSAIASGPDSAFDFAPQLDVRAAIFGMLLFGVFVLAAAAGPALRVVWSASRLAIDVRPTPTRGSRLALASQIAIALVVGIVAVALTQNVRTLTRMTRPDGQRRQAVEIVLPEGRYVTEATHREFFSRLLAALRGRTEIRSAAASSYVPPTQAPGNARFTIEGRRTESDFQSASPAAVDVDAFRALGIPLLHGRLFGSGDGTGAPDVCILSQALARRYWGDVDPIGQRLQIAGLPRPVTIVGIVGDVRQPISTDPRAEAVLYLPFLQEPWPFMTMLIEPAGEAGAALTALREELARLDDAIASGSPRPLADLQTAWLRSPRLHALAAMVFGGASLLLTVAGVYARVAHGVVQRQREWAIRQAIGATPARLRRRIVGEIGGVAAAGVFAGLLALPLVAASGAALVYGADLANWPRALGVSGGVGLAALLAGAAPLRRVTALDLNALLRDE